MKLTMVLALAAATSPLAGCGATVEVAEYHAPAEPGDGLVDDRLADPGPTFDAGLASPRRAGSWLVNLSAAVVKLDVPMIRPDSEPSLNTLHPSYASASARLGKSDRAVLPSIDMIDGKAEQFDDGFRAALELAHYRGLGKPLVGQVALIGRFLARVGPDSPAAPFLAAGLEIAGEKAAIGAKGEADKARWLNEFRASEVRSKPVGHATWSPELTAAFRFSRFFARPFGRDEPAIPRALAGALAGDDALRADYGRTLAFLAILTNPSRRASVANPAARAVSLFPSPTSRESELFDRLFPVGPPPGMSLMNELTSQIRSGRVKLDPRPDGGWYDHQVHALEPLLLPEKADEHAKLLLTKSYKRRRVEAFRALITKRREMFEGEVKSEMGIEPQLAISPRLRVEPCPTYFLRTARAYGFLKESLDEVLGESALRSIHGLREGGAERPLDLRAELDAIRALFFGLALVSSEDVGLEPPCLDAEGLDAAKCVEAALGWLAHPEADPDLGVDARVTATILADPDRQVTRTWATLGIRLAKLDVSFARPPSARPGGSAEPWAVVRPGLMLPSHYLIPVDEFAEVELKGLRVLDRAEFRRICDEGKTREGIIGALER